MHKQKTSGHQFYVRSPPQAISLLQCCLKVFHLAALQDWNNNSEDGHRCHQQPPHPKLIERKGSAAEQPVHSESKGTKQPTDYFSLAFPLHVPLSLFFFVFRDPVWAIKLKTGTCCWQRVMDTPRSSAVYLSTVTTVVSVIFQHLLIPEAASRITFACLVDSGGHLQRWHFALLPS